ncbi:MAG: ABC transporter substrate-binding protein, partial [Bacteroidaceae bacterium]|nr:ABC transporter substrate-binding protein [Bacteroidaceae bacterium]
MKKSLPLFLFLITLVACVGNKTNKSSEIGDTLQFRHAKNLTVVTYEDRMEATLRNPWDSTKVLGKYELKEPLKNIAVFGSVHVALLHELGADDVVGGVCDLEYINQPDIKQGVAEGRIANLGNSMQPNLEEIVNLNPDALMPSPFENSGGLGRVERLGIPIIWCADYMENTPLGRAEWIRFYGRLVGKAKEADSIFSTVEKRYQELRAKAQNAKNKPKLLP